MASRIASTENINVVIDAAEGLLLLHDDALIPHWELVGRAFHSLSLFSDLFNLNIAIVNVQLSEDVLRMLAGVLQYMPLKTITLNNNRFGSSGYEFLVHLLSVIEDIESIDLIRNVMDDGPVQLKFTDSVLDHCTLKQLLINDCGIGRRFPIIHASVPTLLSVDTVLLENNNLGSYGASVISGYLSSNPIVRQLCLEANGFDDKDATKFANALMTNKNLEYLRIYNNKFTPDGIRALIRSVYDDSSLNYIHDSNTTCLLRLFHKDEQAPEGLDLSMLGVNAMDFDLRSFPKSALRRCYKASNENIDVAEKMLQAMGRRKTKIVHALLSNGELGGGRFDIGKTPMEIMPEVLETLHESSILYHKTDGYNLNILFQVIRSVQGAVNVDATSTKTGRLVEKSSRDHDASVVISKKKSRSF